jgi:hypothetical protein
MNTITHRFRNRWIDSQTYRSRYRHFQVCTRVWPLHKGTYLSIHSQILSASYVPGSVWGSEDMAGLCLLS